MANIPVSGPARLDGQVALVTGGAGGIGFEVVKTLAAAGATVIAADLAEADVSGVPGGKVEAVRYDVTSQADTDKVVDKIKRDHGKIDVLVLCAGTIANTHLVDSTDAEWESIWKVNVMGVVNPLRKIFPLMRDAGYGKIVCLGSVAVRVGGVASGPAYVAAKSAVHGIVKWVAKNGAKDGVFINAVAPGPVETNMWAKVTERAPPSPNASVPLGRYGQPEDIAQAILFLASPASNWITGQTVDINGGSYFS